MRAGCPLLATSLSLSSRCSSGLTACLPPSLAQLAWHASPSHPDRSLPPPPPLAGWLAGCPNLWHAGASLCAHWLAGPLAAVCPLLPLPRQPSSPPPPVSLAPPGYSGTDWLGNCTASRMLPCLASLPHSWLQPVAGACLDALQASKQEAAAEPASAGATAAMARGVVNRMHCYRCQFYCYCIYCTPLGTNTMRVRAIQMCSSY